MCSGNRTRHNWQAFNFIFNDVHRCAKVKRQTCRNYSLKLPSQPAFQTTVLWNRCITGPCKLDLLVIHKPCLQRRPYFIRTSSRCAWIILRHYSAALYIRDHLQTSAVCWVVCYTTSQTWSTRIFHADATAAKFYRIVQRKLFNEAFCLMVLWAHDFSR